MGRVRKGYVIMGRVRKGIAELCMGRVRKGVADYGKSKEGGS